MNAADLKGTSYQAARLYGMPHVSARYFGEGVNRYRHDDDAVCPVCGRRAYNAHHEPPKSKGHVFALRTEWGSFCLRPALIALCGSGTTGCHGLRHSGRLSIDWVWDDPADEEGWVNGFLLSHGFVPHDPRLYGLGRWVFALDGEEVAEWRG